MELGRTLGSKSLSRGWRVNIFSGRISSVRRERGRGGREGGGLKGTRFIPGGKKRGYFMSLYAPGSTGRRWSQSAFVCFLPVWSTQGNFQRRREEKLSHKVALSDFPKDFHFPLMLLLMTNWHLTNRLMSQWKIEDTDYSSQPRPQPHPLNRSIFDPNTRGEFDLPWCCYSTSLTPLERNKDNISRYTFVFMKFE